MARVEGTTTMTHYVENSKELNNQFVPLAVKRLPKRVLGETTEEKHWREFKKRSEIVGEFKGRASCIDFSQKAPHTCVVTGQGKIMLFDPKTHEKLKDVHPNDTVYCTKWRADGKMLVSSGEKTSIKIWTNGTMKMIRELQGDSTGEKGHKRAVHSVCFLPDKQRIISGSDDNKAIVWDATTQQQIVQLKGHKDYVRATAAHPFNKDIVATGSHDHTVRAWSLADIDTDPNPEPTHIFEVDDPVNCVVFHPSGGMLAAASSTNATIWDASEVVPGETVTSNAPVCLLSNHTKDITCLAFNHKGSRLFTASIDRHIKIYETETYTVVHSISLPQPLYSVAISPDGNCFAAGAIDGKVYLRTRAAREGDEVVDQVVEDEEVQEIQMYSGLGDLTKTTSRNWHKPSRGTKIIEGEYEVEAEHAKRLKRYDVAFRKFNYHKALDEVVNEPSSNLNRYMLIMTVLIELQRRNGLRIALSNRDASELAKILREIHRGV
eukprot:TRINITY_DN16000_c0_g1_i1.p1 TRINITY_DN16000_c0_g1~~TRINITY_DN16000_c0_g1_i1.p1  ORF type:complete len:511 (+),score=156.29 TRINITY_DN16000_c0_g1_i1:59-1534(+)